MGYTPPPTFADGTYLSAAQLNVLSDDVEFLYGRALMPVTNFYRNANINSVDSTQTRQGGWALMHLTNTFRYRIRLVQGTSSELQIRANGLLVYQDSTTRNRISNTDYVWDATADITSLALTEGAVYGLEIRFTGPTGTNIITVDYLGEDWSNTGYSTPPTFTNGNNLTAAQLNTLSDDVAFLYDRSLQPNVGFFSGKNLESNYTTGDISDPGNHSVVERGWWNFKHVSNTLYYRLKLTQGSSDEVKVEVNGQQVWSDGFTKNAPHLWEGTLSLASLNLTVGNTYSINVYFRGESSVDQLTILYVGEVW